MKNAVKFIAKKLALAAPMALWSIVAAASTTTSLPWDDPMQTLVNSLTGPILLALSVIAIVACGVMLSFGDFSSTGKKIICVIMGISLACAAPSVVISWFHFSGAVI